MGRTPRAAFLVVFILLLAACGAGNEGRFTLVNGSSDRIASARVEVCGQVSEYRELAPGAEVRGTFRVRGDSSYGVSVTFGSGSKLDREVGYVTRGFDFENVITVTGSSIEITGGPVPASE